MARDLRVAAALCPPDFLFCKVRTWNKSSPPSTTVVISHRKRQARPPAVGGLRGGGGQSCAWEKFRFVETSQGGACSPTRQVWALPCPSAALRGPGQPPSQAPGLAHVAVLVTSLPRGDSSVAVGPASQSCTRNSSRTGGWEAQGPRVLGVVPRSWQPAPRPCVAVMPGLGQAGPGLTAGGRVLRGRQAAPAAPPAGVQLVSKVGPGPRHPPLSTAGPQWRSGLSGSWTGLAGALEGPGGAEGSEGRRAAASRWLQGTLPPARSCFLLFGGDLCCHGNSIRAERGASWHPKGQTPGQGLGSGQFRVPPARARPRLGPRRAPAPSGLRSLPQPGLRCFCVLPSLPVAVSSLVLHRSGAQRGFAGVHGAPVSGASGESGQSPSHSWGLWVSPPPSLPCCRSHGQLQVRVGVGLSPCGG